MKIYLASSEKYVGKIQEDLYLRNSFIQKGFECKILTLKNITKISRPSDLVILKSIWGYHLNPDKFIQQISWLKKNKVKLVNDYDFIFWNINKYKYLSALNKLSIIPTKFISFKDVRSQKDIRKIILHNGELLNSESLVIKPCVSASGYLTLKYDINKKNLKAIEIIQKNKKLDFIIQPYRDNVILGELSIIIIGGISMYGIKRFPAIFTEKKELEYITKSQFSRKIKRQLDLLNAFFISNFNKYPKICRVDFVGINSNYELMEVELIDPDLFLKFIPKQQLRKCLEKLASI